MNQFCGCSFKGALHQSEGRGDLHLEPVLRLRRKILLRPLCVCVCVCVCLDEEVGAGEGPGVVHGHVVAHKVHLRETRPGHVRASESPLDWSESRLD